MSGIGAFLDTLGPWGWWILALILAGVEIMLPGAFFIWFAAAALIVGANGFLFDWGWQVQLISFGVLAVIAALIGRRFYGRNAVDGGDELLNDRARRQIGRRAVLEEPIVNGTGRVRLDDTLWRVWGPDLPTGTAVRIVAAGEGRLQVEPEIAELPQT